MTSQSNKSSLTLNNLKLSRDVRRPPANKPKTLIALPDDIPESTWVDILNIEETELMILSVREDIVEQATAVCYERYLERQKFAFTAHCAGEAWLQIIDWYYFRHDPGEDPSAYPPADIPNREESWIPDYILEPSPKDTWCRHDLEVGDAHEEVCCCSPSDTVEGMQKDEEEGIMEETEREPVDGPTSFGRNMSTSLIVQSEKWKQDKRYRTEFQHKRFSLNVKRLGKEDKESCPCDSNIAESNPCVCSEQSKDGVAVANMPTTSNYSCASVTKNDSSPHGPVSSECGGGDSSTSGTKPRRIKNIFSQSTSGRSKQTLPPLPALRPTQKSSKTRRK